MENTEYSINATGDCCVGDEVMFDRAVFTGTYPKAKFSHSETIIGAIIKDSYGKDKQQHTFTIEIYTIDGKRIEEMICADTIRIKGRNLYRNGIKRKPWANEEERKLVLDEKHTRGSAAREKANERKSYKMSQKESDYIDNYNEGGEE